MCLREYFGRKVCEGGVGREIFGGGVEGNCWREVLDGSVLGKCWEGIVVLLGLQPKHHGDHHLVPWAVQSLLF